MRTVIAAGFAVSGMFSKGCSPKAFSLAARTVKELLRSGDQEGR